MKEIVIDLQQSKGVIASMLNNIVHESTVASDIPNTDLGDLILQIGKVPNIHGGQVVRLQVKNLRTNRGESTAWVPTYHLLSVLTETSRNYFAGTKHPEQYHSRVVALEELSRSLSPFHTLNLTLSKPQFHPERLQVMGITSSQI